MCVTHTCIWLISIDIINAYFTSYYLLLYMHALIFILILLTFLDLSPSMLIVELKKFLEVDMEHFTFIVVLC